MVTSMGSFYFLAYDPACVLQSDFTERSDNTIRTRGNKYKLIQRYCHYDVRNYNFTNCVIPKWNCLSNYVVSAETINIFKNRLDKFWSDQKVLHNDNKSDLHGIRNYSTTVKLIHNGSKEKDPVTSSN